MKIIADSGTTKTSWAIIDEGKETLFFETDGLNPLHSSSEKIEKIFSDVYSKSINSDVNEIFFYGAGCGNNEAKNSIKYLLKKYFIRSEIFVESDLLAACKATCGNNSGVVCILGTGSNSCIYDGKNIVHQISPLGYFLGDEGSGNYITKLFLKKLLRNELSNKISDNFFAKYQEKKEDVIKNIYGEEILFHLKKYNEFIILNSAEPLIEKVIREAFEIFFSDIISKYPEYKKYSFNAVGSVAFGYSAILLSVLLKHGIQIEKILKIPIEALTEFHNRK